LRDYEGRVRLVVKDFPLPSHPKARLAHEAARCAADGGRFWPYHDRLYEEQPRFERAELIQYAAEVGLDADAFTRCLEARPHAAAVEADISQGRGLGVRGTPSFVINGELLVGAQPVEAFRRAVDAALARSR
jgi:protein-disulfide isomerase